jgi:DNA-binding response OmpR family regulator
MIPQDGCGQGKRVLIVDDSVDTAQMVKILLKLEGYEARTAFDGREALKTAGTFLPDVVLLDLTLPDMTGQQVAAELRKDAVTAGALVIAVSGYDDLDVPPGFDHFLVKPMDHDALRAILTAAGSRHGATCESLKTVGVG